MNLIYLVKILNLAALAFIPLNYIYAVFGYDSKSGLIYLWLCVIGFLINYCSKKKSKLIYLPMVVIFLPLITTRSIEELIYLAVYCMITILIIFKGMNVFKYDTELDLFRKGIYICTGTCIASLIIGGIQFFTSYCAYYVIIYLVTSILLLRNIRFMEYNRDSREGKGTNIRYSIIIVIFSFILSISYVREIVIKIIKDSYYYITELFIYLFSWLFLGIGYLVSILYTILYALLKKLGKNIKGLEPITQAKKADLPKSQGGKVLIDKLLYSPIFNIIIKAFVILLVVYIIIRLFKGLANNKSQQEDYSEEKEFILRSNEKNKNLKKRFLDFLKPRNYSEQIRLYYKSYMKKCMDNDIDITEKDTTEEISDKSQIKFDKKLIDGMRSIYIKIRYGEKEPSSDMVKEMGRYYKEIKKQ